MRKLLFKAPVLTASGYGVHARQVLKAVLASRMFDVSVRSLTWGNTSIIHERSEFLDLVRDLAVKGENEAATGTRYDVSIQVTIPNEFERLADINVGFTAGIEVDRVAPEWIVKANEDIDILFVPSQHSKGVFENTTFQTSTGEHLRLNKPAHVAPEGVDTRVFNTADHAPDESAFEAGFNFLFVGLGLKGDLDGERKGITRLIKTFLETFKGREDVGLVLKTAIVNNSYADFERTKQIITRIKRELGIGDLPRISLVHGRLSKAEMAKLYRDPKIKCFVSLTRGEGFGLPLLEAAACGLPVMASGWSGHVDFLRHSDGEKSFVELEHDLVPVPQSALWKGVIMEGSQWAEPREDDVVLKMKKVIAKYDIPNQWAVRLADDVSQRFSEDVVGHMFVTDLVRLLEQHRLDNPRSFEEAVRSIRTKLGLVQDRRSLLYTMPMSAGDVFISTAVVDSLKKKFPDHDIYFATQQQYASILEGNPDIHRVVEYQQWMTNVPLLEAAFDEVYTPNLAIQTVAANWVHGGKGRLLADEMAAQCGVELGEYKIETKSPLTKFKRKYIVLHPGSGKGQWEARNYLHWQEIVKNLERELGDDVQIWQVGLTDDPLYDGALDLRGKTTFQELAWIIEHATLVLGIDSVSMHMAAALGTDHISLFGSSYPTSTGPVRKKNSLSVLLETPDRYTCTKACYKYQCSVDRNHPCINEIDPKVVYEEVLYVLGMHSNNNDELGDAIGRYEKHSPKISGYTHVLNAKSQEYPFIQSISSMLGFCDEVVVVDGGSTDGTLEALHTLKADSRLKVIDNPWDWDEPGMDGKQKAFARAMCTGEFLWQQDVDEVVHEKDYEKIRKLVKRFPKDVDILHLPVVELWGDDRTVRTDRHSWKWRLSRNNFRITHGINKDARVMDPETGRVHSKKGMSDGCEYVDIMTHEFLPHKGFYSNELEQLRRTDPEEYGRRMNDHFDELPSVFHYSWADIPRKVRNFKLTWDKLWTGLYRDSELEDRFPSVEGPEDVEGIERVSKELNERGGEHGPAKTFILRRDPPKLMEGWLP